MPLHAEDLSTIMASNGQPADIISHNTKYISFQNVETTRSLKVISTWCWEWAADDTVPAAAPWNEVAGLALTITGTSASAKTRPVNDSIFSLKEVERVWGGLLGIAEPKEYPTLGALATELRVAFEKLPRERQQALAFQGDCIGQRIQPGEWPPALRFRQVSEEWEDLITYGLLADNSRKLAGFLQRFMFPSHQACFCESKLFKTVQQYLSDKGIISEELIEAAEEVLPDDAPQQDADERTRKCAKVARAVVAALAKAADLPESMMRGPTDEEHACDLATELIEGADSIFDGNSEFMLKHVRSNVSALAPTTHELLSDTTDDVAFRGYIMDLAATYPRDVISPDPKTLLALAGIKSLERRLVNYASFVKAATTKAMHVGERVALLIERIQRAERQTSADRRFARRAHSAAPPAPPTRHTPACSAVTKPAHTREDGWGVPRPSLHQATRTAETYPATRTWHGCTAEPDNHPRRPPLPAQLGRYRPGDERQRALRQLRRALQRSRPHQHPAARQGRRDRPELGDLRRPRQADRQQHQPPRQHARRLHRQDQQGAQP